MLHGGLNPHANKELEMNKGIGHAVAGYGSPEPGPDPRLADRIRELEEELKATVQVTARAYGDLQDQLLLTIRMVKDTIRAVERLAKGKSLGTLGLPSKEQWDPPYTRS